MNLCANDCWASLDGKGAVIALAHEWICLRTVNSAVMVLLLHWECNFMKPSS